MSVGELFLESVSTGVIQEEATVLKLGRLLDAGRIQIGCRLLRA